MERTLTLKDKKGQVGLEILLSIIVILFVIGFLVTLFAILGGEMEDEAFRRVTGTVANETTSNVVNDTVGINLAQQVHNNPTCTVFEALNATGLDDYQFSEGNWSTTECRLYFAGTADDNLSLGNNGSIWNVSYTYIVDQNTTASLAMAKGTEELAETTDWFGIIIIIGAMIVLILLTLIIINAIRSAGFLGGIAVGGRTPRETA